MSDETALPVALPVAETGHEAMTLEPGQVPGQAPPPADDRRGLSEVLHEIASGSVLLTVLAIVAALVVGAVLIVVTNAQVISTAGYFFARPGDMLGAIGSAVGGAYAALFQGGVYDFTATDFASGIQPLLTSLGFATPLIAAGLGIAIGFRAGLFNIGGQGQMLAGGVVAGYVGFAWHLPPVIHLVVAVLAGLGAGALWAAIAGFLKAQTGAHEVIVTIMLNWIAFYGVDQLLHMPILQKPGSINPQSPAELPTATLPTVAGVNLGFVLVILATVVAWWLLSRSSLGFKFRAVGENLSAARTAGISVKSITVIVMLVSGALVGLAGLYQTLGQTPTGFTNDFDAGIGFNAITVALLGRSRPWGVFWSGILFGVFQAGGYTMQAAQGIDVDIVGVVQSVIVLFIAAPPLVRSIFRLPAPGSRSRRKAAA